MEPTSAFRLSADEEAVEDGETACTRAHDETQGVARGVVLDALRPQLRGNEHRVRHFVLPRKVPLNAVHGLRTVPPRMGPANRARLTMLCAMPFAKPTRWGGDTGNIIRRAQRAGTSAQVPGIVKVGSGNGGRTVIEQYRNRGVAECTTAIPDRPRRNKRDFISVFVC